MDDHWDDPVDMAIPGGIQSPQSEIRRPHKRLFVTIVEHPLAQCPGSNKEVFDIETGAMQMFPDLEKKQTSRIWAYEVSTGAEDHFDITRENLPP
jgi:hypothetical protein